MAAKPRTSAIAKPRRMGGAERNPSPSLTVEQWLAANTQHCALGRVTPGQCAANRARPNVADWCRKGNDVCSDFNREIRFKPLACESCPGLGKPSEPRAPTRKQQLTEEGVARRRANRTTARRRHALTRRMEKLAAAPERPAP